jgi:hypothetical protein
VHIEDEDAAAVEAGEPELAAIVGEAAVVRFVPSAYRGGVDDFAIVRRPGFHIYRDKFIGAVAETFDAQRPDIDKLLLPIDPGEVR